MAKRVPTIGNNTPRSSYPDSSLAGDIGSADTSLGSGPHNWNAVNYVTDPDVFNASPATKKSYSWNKGDTGNAT